MTADLEAATRALADHGLVIGYGMAECVCGLSFGRVNSTREFQEASKACRAHLASVLASLPDDRLAEAEADHNLLIEADSCLSYVRHRRASSLTDDDRREMDSLLSRLRPRTDAIIRERRAALSGGDAT